jgi:hypothetical protein
MRAIPLPGHLEDKLAASEADPTHIPAARDALEAALTWQLRVISLALLADRLMQSSPGRRPSRDVWWHQYTLNTKGYSVFRPPDDDDDAAGLRTFRQELAAQIAKGVIRRLRPADAPDLALRVLGGYAGLGDEGHVNAQLMALGSDCHYLVEPGEKLRAARAAALASLPHTPFGHGIIFFFGLVEPATVIGRIRFIRFTAELAVSPYENPDSPLFYRNGRLVARHFTGAELLHAGLYGHEFTHIVMDLIDNPRRGVPSWRAIVRQDLCRYLRQPRTAEEIQAAFFPSWLGPHGELESMVIPAQSWFPAGEAPAGNPIGGLVDELVKDGLAERRDGRFVCRLYEEGRRWLV